MSGLRPSSRERIVAAALEHAASQGDADVSLAAYAEAAGVTKQGLNYHFPSKPALRAAMLDAVFDRWEAAMAETLEKPLQDATTGQRIRAYAAVAARRRRRRGTVAVRTTDAHRRGQRRLRTMDRALAQPRSGDAVRGARAGTHRLAGRQQSVVGTRHRQASFERRRSHRSSRDNFGIDHSGRLSHAEVMADTATTAPDTCFAEFFSALTTVAQTGTTESRPDRALIWVSTWMLMVSPGRARSSCRRDQ